MTVTLCDACHAEHDETCPDTTVWKAYDADSLDRLRYGSSITNLEGEEFVFLYPLQHSPGFFAMLTQRGEDRIGQGWRYNLIITTRRL